MASQEDSQWLWLAWVLQCYNIFNKCNNILQYLEIYDWLIDVILVPETMSRGKICIPLSFCLAKSASLHNCAEQNMKAPWICGANWLREFMEQCRHYPVKLKSNADLPRKIIEPQFQGQKNLHFFFMFYTFGKDCVPSCVQFNLTYIVLLTLAKVMHTGEVFWF